jgi:hypothetical protein
MKTIGWKYYIVFCCLLAALLAIVPFPIPKTKGRSLEEIAEIFDGRQDSLPWVDLHPHDALSGGEICRPKRAHQGASLSSFLIYSEHQ